MKRLTTRVDGFEVPETEAREFVNARIKDLGFPGSKVVSNSLGIPYGQFARVLRGGEMDVKYLPILYNHFRI